MTPRPLTAEQREAARVLAEGGTQRQAADAAGTSPTSVRRWEDRDDFAALAAPTPAPSHTTAPVRTSAGNDTEEEAVLREVMLTRTTKGDLTGAAVKAAVALANLKAARAAENAAVQTVERILLTGHDDLDGQVRSILDGYREDETVYIMLAERNAGPNARGAQIIGLKEGPWQPLEADAPTVPADPQPDSAPTRDAG